MIRKLDSNYFTGLMSESSSLDNPEVEPPLECSGPKWEGLSRAHSRLSKTSEWFEVLYAAARK